MFTVGQLAAVTNAFRLAGYDGPIVTAPVSSDDERWFLLDAVSFRALRDVDALSQVLQQVLGCKAGVLEIDERWGPPIPFE